MYDRTPAAVFLVPVVLLLVALGDMPYGYYQLLRLALTIAAIWIAVGFAGAERSVVAIVFGLMALVYNPVLPIGFPRETWQMINIGTVVALLGGLAIARAARKPKFLPDPANPRPAQNINYAPNRSRPSR